MKQMKSLQRANRQQRLAEKGVPGLEGSPEGDFVEVPIMEGSPFPGTW